MFLYLIVYLSIIIFLVAVIKRIVAYGNKLLHIRWKLYPVPHESGVSYLEDVDWWDKPRELSKISELSVMLPEILLLKGVWKHNRPLWFATFPFHFGLYLCIGFNCLPDNRICASACRDSA